MYESVFIFVEIHAHIKIIASKQHFFLFISKCLHSEHFYGYFPVQFQTLIATYSELRITIEQFDMRWARVRSLRSQPTSDILLHASLGTILIAEILIVLQP